MQKLVWQNANGETIDLTSGSYGITEWEGFSNASLNIQSQQVPFQDGAVFLDALIEPRELSVTLKMQDNNDLELRYQLRRELIHKLNPKLGEGYLIYTNDFISKRIKCVAQIPLFETHNSNDSGTPKASLSWTASEPYWEDLEETVVAISGLNTIQNEGDVSAQVEILIPTGASNPAIANRRNQKQIKLVGSFENAIDINTNYGRKSITSEEINYTWVSGGRFNGVTYGNNKYVYVGTQLVVNDILLNKIISINMNLPTLNKIIFANNQFIVVGSEGIILTSPDGITWTQRTSGINTNLLSITFGNNLFVAVGPNCILTSADGITWTNRSSGTITGYNSVCYGNNLFVAVNMTDRIATSPDGITWTQRTSSGTQKALKDITFGNDLFVAVGVGGVILTSSDGITWNRIENSGYLGCITYGNNRFIVFREGYTEDILTSSDGINWTSESSGFREVFYDVCYNNQFVAVGAGGFVITSLDGITWIKEYGDTDKQLNSVIYAKDLFITVGANQVSLVSPDGITWTKNNGIAGPFYYSVVFGNNIFVKVGQGGNINLSTNGLTWSYVSSPTENNLKGVIYNNKFIAVGEGGVILTSENGTSSWTNRTSGINTDLLSITFGNNIFVAVGVGGVILTSSDGITWTQRTSGTNEDLLSLVYGDNIFVAVGVGGVILTSSDGINWTNRTSGIDVDIYGIAYGNNKYIAVSNNIILFSFDGIIWICKYIYSNTTLRSVVYGNNKWVMVGDGGKIVNSYISEILNLISDLTYDSDMTFKLEVGNNDILYSDDNGNGATLKFRQKYIGV